MARLLVLLLAASWGQLSGQAQEEVRVEGVEMNPRGVATGDPGELHVRLTFPPGMEPIPPDTITFRSGMASRGPVSVSREGAVGSFLLSYPVQLLRPGSVDLPPLRLRLPRGSSGEGGEWALLELGTLTVRPVIPPEEENPTPAPPATLPCEGGSRRGRLGVLGLLLGLVTLAVAAWARSLAVGAEGGKRSASPLLDTGRVRAELESLLRDGLEGAPPPAIPWERGLLLFRTLLLAEMGEGNGGQTSSEILSSLETRGASQRGLIRSLLTRGDRFRFSGKAPDDSEAVEVLLQVREWMEGHHA